jgi:broad specificity phosphatase PhoE
MIPPGWAPSQFYFVRHGQSLNNQLDLVNGWTDSPLTDMGILQARKAASILKNCNISRVICSDLKRAHLTANIISHSVGIRDPEVHLGLRERYWGPYENLPRDLRPCTADSPSGVESVSTFEDRVIKALTECRISSNTVVVAHAGVGRILLKHLCIHTNFHRFPNSTPYVILRKSSHWQIKPL